MLNILSRSRVVFSGGMCNAINHEGQSVRNPHRDELNARLKSAGHSVFDPQIDETTHGRPYKYEIDGPAEQKARADAHVTIYELGEETMAGVTMLEILRDVGIGKQVILWLSGELDGKGKPQFKPAGFNPDSITDPATKAHAVQMVKQGNSMRANLLDFTKGSSRLRVETTLDGVVASLKQFGVRI